MTRPTPSDWSDRDLYVICGGPSLKGWDLAGLRERGRVLGVNRAAEFWTCDAVVSIDRVFIRKRWGWLASLARGPIEVHLGFDDSWPFPRVPGATHYRKNYEPGLSHEHGELRGLNSGFAAMNLGILLGARRIVLLGLDLHMADGGHWHGGYEWGTPTSKNNYGHWAKCFDDAASELPAGVEVVNANPESAVRGLPVTSYSGLGLHRIEGLR